MRFGLRVARARLAASHADLSIPAARPLPRLLNHGYDCLLCHGRARRDGVGPARPRRSSDARRSFCQRTARIYRWL